MKLVIILMFFTAFAFADDIYFKSGAVVYNCEVVEETEEFIKIRMFNPGGEEYRQFGIGLIERIERKSITTTEVTRVVYPGTNSYVTNSDKLNAEMLPAIIIGGTLTWSFFDGISDQPKSMKTKNIIRGSLTGIATVLALIKLTKGKNLVLGTNGREVALSINL